MNWLNRLEAKYGRYAIRNLPLYIVVLYAFGTIMNLINPYFYSMVSLNPALIMQGQIWRLVTFLMAVSNGSPIFLIFVMLFYYSISQELCMVWGNFRFNMYYLIGILFNIVAAFLVFFISPAWMKTGIYMDTYYLNLSLFLAYAAIFPDAMIYLYGILPLRIKWLAMIDVLYLAVEFFTGGLGSKIAIVVSLLNFLLFFLSSRNYKRISPKEVHRKKVYRQKVQQHTRITRHQCAICKRTELDNPDLEFRFCSKCNGDFEYCNDHLFTHTHVK